MLVEERNKSNNELSRSDMFFAKIFLHIAPDGAFRVNA
jgi:hypothetical protein